MALSKSELPLTLKVLTVNAHKGFSIFNRRFILPELRDAIRQAAPDIVFLQEVQGEHHRHARNHNGWPSKSHYEFLADSLWSDFAYGRNAVYPAGHHGNAILSRYPISTFENHDVSVSRHESRGLLHCVLLRPDEGVNIHVVCVHLGLREKHRSIQLHRLCELVTSTIVKDEPMIIAGDFNDWRLQADRSMHRCGVTEVFTEAHGQPARTFPARWPLLRLDRIYVRNVGRTQPITMATRPWSHLSDHIPLAAEIDV